MAKTSQQIRLNISLDGFFFYPLLPSLKAQTIDDNISEKQLLSNPEQLIGQAITLRGEIEAINNPTFIIHNDEWTGKKNFLVINVSGKPIPLLPREQIDIQVTGQVRPFNVEQVSEEFGLGFDPEYYQNYANQPVIFAQSIALAPSPGEVTSNYVFYYEEAIAVEGEIEEVITPQVFTLKDKQLLGGGDLLVINPNAETSVSQGETVLATGTVKLLNFVELEQDYNLTWDSDERREIESKFTNKPVLIVDQLYPAAVE